MALLSIQQIQQGLSDKFGPLEPMLAGFRLINNGVTEDAMIHIESSLSVTFPMAFREAIKAFDFGKLTIGPVAFCNTGDYLSDLRKLNTAVRWWGDGGRPTNFLMVANSDPYAVLLSMDTGSVWAMDPERGYQKVVCVAGNFRVYLRALGTIMLRRENSVDKALLAREVAADVGELGLGYWEYLVK